MLGQPGVVLGDDEFREAGRAGRGATAANRVGDGRLLSLRDRDRLALAVTGELRAQAVELGDLGERSRRVIPGGGGQVAWSLKCSRSVASAGAGLPSGSVTAVTARPAVVASFSNWSRRYQCRIHGRSSMVLSEPWWRS